MTGQHAVGMSQLQLLPETIQGAKAKVGVTDFLGIHASPMGMGSRYG